MPTLAGLDPLRVRERRVLLRVDLNVSSHDVAELMMDYRLQTALPSLRWLVQHGARVGILTHRGRPGGRVQPEQSNASLLPALQRLLPDVPMDFVPDCVGRMAEQRMQQLPPGQVLLLENTRFYAGEVMNDPAFAQQLAKLGEVLVNDAFASAHRAQASTSGLAQVLPLSVVGLQLAQELAWLRRLNDWETKRRVLVLGGRDVGPKLELMQHVLHAFGTVMLGGVLAHIFLAARDYELGHSVVDPMWVETARNVLAEAGVVGCRVHMPQDFLVRQQAGTSHTTSNRAAHKVGPDEMAVDLGSATMNTWQRLLQQDHADSAVVWLGSLGMVEQVPSSAGSLQWAEWLAARQGWSLTGGTGLLQRLGTTGVRERLPAVSSGGGALLAALKNRPLPGVPGLIPVHNRRRVVSVAQDFPTLLS